MAKNKKLLKIFIILITWFIFLISVINILCTKVRPIMQEKLAGVLKRKIEIGPVYCFTLRGVTIKDLVIYNATNEHPLYHFKELKISPSLLSLILEKKLKFSCEIFPTPKFRAHIYIVGNYNFNTRDLFLKFRLRDVPYTRDLGSIYGTLHLYKNPAPKEGEHPTNLMELTFTSEKMLLSVNAEFIDKETKTDIIGKIYSPFIKIDKFQLANIKSDAALLDDKLYVYNLTSDLHKGILDMDGYVDLDNPVNPFALNIDVKNMDLDDFSRNSSLVKKEIYGAADVKIKLKGSFGYTNSMFGNAWVEIKDANFWESGIFKGVAEVLLIPDLKKIIFTNAHGAFRLKNNRIYTDNFQLVSNPLEFVVKGNIGFDGSISANVRTKFKRELIESSVGFSKLSSILLESTGWFLGDIKISGNIKDPSFAVIPVGVGNIFDKVKDAIDKVKGILK